MSLRVLLLSLCFEAVLTPAIQAASGPGAPLSAGDWGRPESLSSPPALALGFPSRAADLDARPGFQNPPAGYGEVPFWWWTGDPLDKDRLLWQIEQLHRQGVHCCDVAIMYPVAPSQAGLGGKEAAGIDFDFMDFQSLARAEVRDGRLHVSGEAYRVLVLPALRAVEWSTIRKAREFRRAGGIVIAVSALPEASDRCGRDDSELNAAVKELFGAQGTDAGLALGRPDQAPGQVERLVPRQVQASSPVKAWHRRIGPRDVYMVLGAAKGSECTFRSRGRVEAWDPWTGRNRLLQAVSQSSDGTKVRMPLEDYEAQVIVFSPGENTTDVPVRNDVVPTAVLPVSGSLPRGRWISARTSRRVRTGSKYSATIRWPITT
jgi:hypothetical protein